MSSVDQAKLRAVPKPAPINMSALAEADLNETSYEQDATRGQIRGSSLFLAGRFISLGANFVTQVLIVRYLSTVDYGALAYVLATIAFLQLFGTLGLQEAVSRFVPIYREHRDYERLFGTILLAVGAVVFTGILIIALAGGPLSHFIARENLTLRLLSILIFLVPVEAADMLLDALFASFASTRDIFFRKYVLGPGLKLGVAILLIWRGSTVTFLAAGYLCASALGVLTYSWMLLRLLRSHGLWQQVTLRTIKFPARELLAFIVPGLSAVLATAAINSINMLLLGQMQTLSEVAYYRAAVPLAEMNGVVMASFTLLYTPTAARLFARGNYAGINKLYWQTAAWMSVVAFPIFVSTFSLARPVIALLYGSRYERSAFVMAVLALGGYFNVTLGFNVQTLKVIGRLRYIIVTSLLAALANIALNCFLIPRYGAVGAAAGATVALVGYNVLLQLGLRQAPSFKAFDSSYCSIYLVTAMSALGLLVLQYVTSIGLPGALPLAVGLSVAVLLVSKKKLNITATFPELYRVPFMRVLLTTE